MSTPGRTSTPGRPPQGDGSYSQLVDEEDHYNHGYPPSRGSQGGSQGGSPAYLAIPSSVVRRLRGLGSLRLAVVCLAALSATLLISIIAVAAHNKAGAPGGGAAVAEVQKQTQGANVSALMDSINKLQQEKDLLLGEKEKLAKAQEETQRAQDEQQRANGELRRENQELRARLAATKAPEVEPEPTSAAVVCPDGWNLFNGSCYFISRTTRDWPESKAFCESKGAHLAIIRSAEEQTFLWDLLPRGHWNSYWFGLSDGHTEDVWKWVDGSPLLRDFWEAGEPNNHVDEDCGYMVKTTVLERVAVRSWYDAPCDMYLPFICEKLGGPAGSTAKPH